MDLNKELNEYCKEHEIQNIGVNMYVFSHNDMIGFANKCSIKKLSLFQKNRLDLLNWAKGELTQETNTKLGKTMTPYRSDKIRFLRRIIDWVDNE